MSIKIIMILCIIAGILGAIRIKWSDDIIKEQQEYIEMLEEYGKVRDEYIKALNDHAQVQNDYIKALEQALGKTNT